jgi:hypothetical protein
MHYWFTRTCHSFTRNGSELFRDNVAKEALEHDYLLHAVFAVTLLQQASALQDPMEVQPLVDAALQNQNLAVSGLSEMLQAISSYNCDAVFLSSVLIMVCAIISPLLPVRDDERTHSISEILWTLVQMMKGISSVVEVARPWVEEGPLHKFLCVVERGPLHKATAPGNMESSGTSNWTQAAELRQLIGANTVQNLQSRSVYEAAVIGLEIVINGEISAVAWIMNYADELMDGLRDKDPITMAIFMHWAVLLYVTGDDMWWKKYAGLKLVQELAASFVNQGVEWERMSGRCQRQVGLQGLWDCPGKCMFPS